LVDASPIPPRFFACLTVHPMIFCLLVTHDPASGAGFPSYPFFFSNFLGFIFITLLESKPSYASNILSRFGSAIFYKKSFLKPEKSEDYLLLKQKNQSIFHFIPHILS
jgi:hypothetical protein